MRNAPDRKVRLSVPAAHRRVAPTDSEHFTGSDFIVSRFLNDGAFADVFDLGDGSVAKVYRRTSHTHGPVLDWDDHDFITRRLYDVEVNAYERLQAFPELL